MGLDDAFELLGDRKFDVFIGKPKSLVENDVFEVRRLTTSNGIFGKSSIFV